MRACECGKTKVMVFNGIAGRQSTCVYGGEELQMVDTFGYLGIEICGQPGLQASQGVTQLAAPN
jgi:hypothetical protein